jgi:formate transporter
MESRVGFDALLPPEMAIKAEDIGVGKADLGTFPTFSLAVLAGAFIALGAVFSTTCITGTAGLPIGVVKLIAGVTFSLGLILIVVGGAELFTGNNLIVMAWASHKVSTWKLIRNWIIVYAGNFVGAILTALIIYLGELYLIGSGAQGLTALNIANAKVDLGFLPALVRGIFCNVLVCLAVWLCTSARSGSDKVLLIIPPISAFVACGFEHSVANMYFIPQALFIRYWASPSFWNSIGQTPTDYPNITVGNFFLGNLLPVTIGNIIGGAVMVGLVYWAIYLWQGRINIKLKGIEHAASEHQAVQSTKN